MMGRRATGMSVAGVLLTVMMTASMLAATALAQTATGTVSGAGTSSRKPNILSVFTNGVEKYAHVYYTAPNFDFAVQSNGFALIYLKDKGVRIGKPVRVGWESYYVGGVRTIGRPVESFDNDKGPRLNVNTIELSGKLEDNVDFTIGYDLDKTGVALRGYVKDPADLKTPTHFRLSYWLPAYTNFPPDMLQTEREARLKGLSFVIRSGQKKHVYPYANSAVFASPVNKCWIEGPVYGTRKLSFEAKSPKTAPMSAWIYEHTAPHLGYRVTMHKREKDSKKLGERLVLLIQ